MLDLLELDGARDDVERRPRVSAGRAAVIAEMTDVCRRILVRGPAAHAPLRVRRVLERRMGVARVVEPVHRWPRRTGFTRAREVADLGIVPVDDERGLSGQLRDGRTPATSDELELAVPVELVPKEVAEAHRPRPQTVRDLRQRRLVDLEQPELGGAGREQRRRHAGDEVRAGAVVRETDLAAQDRSDHCRRRRLAVRRGDERGTERQPPREGVDRVRVELPEELPRHGRAAPRPSDAGEAAGGAREQDLEAEREARFHGPDASESGRVTPTGEFGAVRAVCSPRRGMRWLARLRTFRTVQTELRQAAELLWQLRPAPRSADRRTNRMVRNKGGTRGEIRSSALWGTGSRGGESRSNALWGRGGRGLVLTVAAVFLLGIPLVASASNGGSSNASDGTYIPAGLLRMADSHPSAKIAVIIQSTDGVDGAKKALGGFGSVNRKLKLVDGISATVPAGRLAHLAQLPGLTITSDAPMKMSGSTTYNSSQVWPYESGLAKLWGSNGSPPPSAPTIAVVDSGIQADRADFAGRIVANVNLSTLPTNTTPGDGRGHGTFVAGIAADAASGYAGAAPNAKIAALDVMDDAGVAKTSDVIAACQWILANKAQYDIRVANFSLHSTTPSNFTKDPLDRAVEKLWFNGVTVIAAAGNYGIPNAPSRVMYAPGNDPFVITVGALDVGGTVWVGNDSTAPWSAYGYTYDGFWKPEIGAPGRYMVGPVPAGSTLTVEKAANVTSPGYIQLSGTSFAAPATAGAAAQILARHPSFTPDQVKGALMVTAKGAPNAVPYSGGVGELNAEKAVSVTAPPNPNLALERFVGVDSTGSLTFDASGWTTAARASVSWDTVSWTDISWTDVAWTDVAWNDVAWTDASLADVAWGDVSWQDVSWEDAAEGEATYGGGYTMDPADAAELATDPDLSVPADLLPTSAVDASATTSL